MSTKKPLSGYNLRRMNVPDGTGFGFGFGGDGGGARYLMSGADAQKAANIIKLFEQIKSRPATDAERADAPPCALGLRAWHPQRQRRQAKVDALAHIRASNRKTR
jgi:hypothetical protein